MKGKVFLAVVVLMCLALAAQSALAQPQIRRPREGRALSQAGAGRGGMMGRGGGMFEGLDLTEEQQAKIAKIREEIMEKARNADSQEARREIFGTMREKMQEVLTEEQRKKLAERPAGVPGREGDRPGGPQRPGTAASRARPMGPIQLLDGLLRRLGLNAEQQKKIAMIREEAIKKLHKDIKAVLTEEQNTKLDAAQKRYLAAQKFRATEGRPGAGGPPEERGPRRGEGDAERGPRRGEGDREGAPRGRTRGEGGRQREN